MNNRALCNLTRIAQFGTKVIEALAVKVGVSIETSIFDPFVF